MKVKRWVWAACGGVVGYLLLLCLLTAAESGHPDASIQSFADALWYSVVTLSTVGYGDLYPVSGAGKLIGLLFVLLSVGALAFLVGAAVSLLTGRLLPMLQLRLLRGRHWYVFSQINDGSVALGRSVAEQDRDAVLLYPMEDRPKAPADLNCRFYPDSIARATAGKKSGCKLFFMNERSEANLQQALEALSLGHGVYCCTEHVMEQCPQNLILFNRYECCAREYWTGQPLGFDESQVVLIGDGRYARELLERGLLMNIFGGGHRVHYHVFGDWQDFRCNHPQLGLTVGIDREEPEQDCVLFHQAAWNCDHDLLRKANRILLCSDDEQENLAVLRHLRRWFPVSGQIHLRCEKDVPGEQVFGTNRRLYTAETVMAGRLTQTARIMHQIYRNSTGGSVPGWEELSEFTRQSNLSAADHLLVKIRMLLEDESVTSVTKENCEEAYRRFCADPDKDRYRALEHLRWMRFHSFYNWRYAPVRDNGARCHPSMLPYEQLSAEEQAKDEYAWQLLASLAKEIETDTEET